MNLDQVQMPQLYKEPSSISMNLDLPMMEQTDISPTGNNSVNVIDLDLSIPRDQLPSRNKKSIKKQNMSTDQNIHSLDARQSIDVHTDPYEQTRKQL